MMKVRALPPFDHPVRPLSQRLGAILWPSFCAAAIATGVFGSLVDPIELRNIIVPELEFGRGVGYTVAFFMFWLCTACACTVTWFLLRPASRFNRMSLKEDP
jgi:hypothetical protein